MASLAEILAHVLAISTIAVLMKYFAMALDELPCPQGQCWKTLNIPQLTILTIFISAAGIRFYQNLHLYTIKSLLFIFGGNNRTIDVSSNTTDERNAPASSNGPSGPGKASKTASDVSSGTLSESLDLVCRLGGILILFYVCDKTTLIARAEKQYDRQHFLLLLGALLLAGLATVRRCAGSAPEEEVLGREQTEEWKGWMQVRPSAAPRVGNGRRGRGDRGKRRSGEGGNEEEEEEETEAQEEGA